MNLPKETFWKLNDNLCRSCCEKAEREHTPPELAQWLVDLSERCKRHNAEVRGA